MSCEYYIDAQSASEFHLLPVGKKLMQYDRLGVNVIVKNKRGELSTRNIPFCGELDEFARTDSELTKRCRESCENYELPHNRWGLCIDLL